MGGTNKKVTIGYKYYLDVLFGLWRGPIDKVTRIAVDKRKAWELDPEDIDPFGKKEIQARDLFGGDSREGGVSGFITIRDGDPEQDSNGYLDSKLAVDGPAYRGITTVTLEDCYMGNNPYLKPWSFRGERIHTRQDGIPQWYDDKAEIPSVKEYYNGSGAQESIACIDIDYDLYEGVNFFFGATEHYNPDGLIGATYASPNGPVVATITGADPSDVFLVKKKPSTTSQSRAYVMGWTLSGIPDGEKWATNRFVVTTPDNNSTLYWPGTFDNTSDAEAYAISQNSVVLTGSTAYKIWLWDDINVGGGGLSPPGGGRFFVEILKPRVDQYSCYVAYSCNDMNPAHIVRECLTDPDWGMGYAEADIDDDSFTVAADTLFAELFGLSITWSREGPLLDFVNEILRHIDGVLYVSRESGKFVLKLIRDDYDEGSLITLDESNVVSVSNASRPTVAELVSSVTVNHYDRTTGETGSVTKHNIGLQQVQQGGGNATTVAYPACTSGPLADRLCQRDLTTLSAPLLSAEISATRIAESLNVGDPFILDWPIEGIDSLVMRVQQITLGDSNKQTIVIDALEDVFAMPDAAAAGGIGQGNIWTDPLDEGVEAALPRVITETPYYELVRGLGVGFVEDVFGDDADAGYLLAAAGRQGAETNARLSVDSGGGYTESEALDFCPAATTMSAIKEKDTTVYLATHKDIDLVESNTIAQVGSELIRVDAVELDSTGDYLITMGRGILDTVPAQHSAGTSITFWGYDWTSDAVQYTASDELDVKLQTTLGANTLPFDDAPVDAVTMNSRAIRPYPPGDLKADGISYPNGLFYTGNHVFTWAHRDRLQQTGDIPEDYTATDIGPESGTEYRFDMYATLANLSVVDMASVSGITSNTYTLSGGPAAPDDTIQISVTITAIRDGYESWQSPHCDLATIASGSQRITEDGLIRITEDGLIRITEE